MSDSEQIEIVLTRHYHRMLSAGVAVSDCEESQRNPPATWKDWHAQWAGRGDAYDERAKTALRAGHEVTAAAHFMSAALQYHYAQFMLYSEPDLKKDARTKSADAFRAAARITGRISLEAERNGLRIPAFLSLPPSGKPPYNTVVILPGLEATKVEMSGWEPFFLARGMATVVVEGPGQGELGDVELVPTEYVKAISAVVDVLQTRPDLDANRIAIMGPSLGGLLTSMCAASDSRFAAVVEVGGTFDTKSRWGRANVLSKAGHLSITKSKTLEETEEKIGTWTMAPLAGQITAPFLVVHGELDRIVPLDQSQMYRDAVPHAELVVVPNGNHVCNNIFHIVRPMIADWFTEKLSGTR